MFLMFLMTLIITILLMLFFLLGKSNSWGVLLASVFECGFTSYFLSRFSFSIHYFLVALTFLFLDLELCFLMPFFLEESGGYKPFLFFFVFSMILTLSLIYEWKSGMLDWKT